MSTPTYTPFIYTLSKTQMNTICPRIADYLCANACMNGKEAKKIHSKLKKSIILDLFGERTSETEFMLYWSKVVKQPETIPKNKKTTI